MGKWYSYNILKMPEDKEPQRGRIDLTEEKSREAGQTVTR